MMASSSSNKQSASAGVASEERSPSINVRLVGFDEKRQASMPSAEELQRTIQVMAGLVKPETEEEKLIVRGGGAINQEALINKKLLDARFIEGAYDVQKSIGQIVTNSGGKGTCFRISERLIMTAAHVVKGDQEGYVHFHYYEPYRHGLPGGTNPPVVTFDLDPERFFYSAHDTNLDFAVIAISGNPDHFKDVGIITSCVQAKETVTNSHTNIFSFPDGSPMKVSLRQNVAVEVPRKKQMMDFDKNLLNFDSLSIRPEIVIHEADTEGGSSGAPIFNDNWQLIAIHQGDTRQQISEHEIHLGNYGCTIKYILDEIYSLPGEDLTLFEQKLKGNADVLGVPFTKSAKNFKKT